MASLRFMIMTVVVFGVSLCQALPQQAEPAKKVPRPLELPAVIEAAEQTRLYARLAGIVEKIHVDLGDRIQAGQVLAELSAPEIEAELRQKAALIAQAEAEVELASKTLQEAEAALVVMTPQILEAEACGQRALANHEFRKRDWQRLEQLVAQKAIAKEVLDEGLQRLEGAKADVAEAEAKVKTVKAVREVRLAKRGTFEVGLKIGQARREVALADAQRVQAILRFTKVHAPFAGVVARRNVATGEFVKPAGTEPLFVVVRMDTVRVRVAIPEASVPFVRAGARVLVRVPAVKGNEVEAKISRLAATLDPKGRTRRAEIDLPNPEGNLLPGMSAVVAISGAGSTEEPNQAHGR